MARRREETMKHSPLEKKKKGKMIRQSDVDVSAAVTVLGISKGVEDIKKKKKDKTRKSLGISKKKKEDGLGLSFDQLKDNGEIDAGSNGEVSLMQNEADGMDARSCEAKKLKKKKERKVRGMLEEGENMQDKKLRKRKKNNAMKEGENMQEKKHKKKKKKEVAMSEEGGRIEDKKEDVDLDDVLCMSSGDEDCSKGMKKWVTEYHQNMPGLEVLKQKIDDFLIHHDKKLEEERKEREARAAEGGWTVVTHQRGRKKTVEAETGTTVGSASQVVAEDNMSIKKPKELVDFYRFQKREVQRNEILMLQSKFEQDKKRIQQLRAARKFRPY